MSVVVRGLPCQASLGSISDCGPHLCICGSPERHSKGPEVRPPTRRYEQSELSNLSWNLIRFVRLITYVHIYM